MKKHRANVRVALVFASLARGVGDHAAHFFLNDVRRVRKINAIVVTLAHLPAVQARHFRSPGQNPLGLRENVFLI